MHCKRRSRGFLSRHSVVLLFLFGYNIRVPFHIQIVSQHGQGTISRTHASYLYNKRTSQWTVHTDSRGVSQSNFVKFYPLPPLLPPDRQSGTDPKKMFDPSGGPQISTRVYAYFLFVGISMVQTVITIIVITIA